MASVNRDGVNVYYEQAGIGSPAVLLTHGFACSARLWERQLHDLSNRHQLIAWDARGHDRSDSPADPTAYSRAHAVGDMLAILDACGVARAVLVGHSMGCVLSSYFYLEHPERTAGLVMIGGGAGVPAAQLAGWNTQVAGVAEELRRNGLRPNPAELGQLTAGGILAAPECRLAKHRSAVGLANAVTGMLTFADARGVDALPSFATPTFVIVGEHETLFRQSADRLTSTIPGARQIVIEGAAHTPNLEEPERFNHALRGVLDSLRNG